MNVVGVDLAWSDTGKGRTGLCAVTGDAVVDSALVRTDDEIVDWLRPRVTRGFAVVAIDAPLIVANRTGGRPCDRAISRIFGRYWAGAHSASLSRPGFECGPRGLRLAQRLGLGVDPELDSKGPTARAIEVYPHPALVTLFDLPRRLPYKAKSGRPLEVRREAFEDLIRLLESLKRASPPLDVTAARRWSALRRCRTSTVGAELDRLEDELDAFVCAYIGLYHVAHGAPRSVVVGDVKTGYIVVPVAGAKKGAPLHESAVAFDGLTFS